METQIPDKNGNALLTYEEGNKIEIKIKLADENRMRSVGYINKEQRILYVKRSLKKHLHRKSGCYGFNYMLIKDAKRFDRIIITDEYGSYIISRELLLNEGNFDGNNAKILNFKTQGFELQIFYPVEKLTEELYNKNVLVRGRIDKSAF